MKNAMLMMLFSILILSVKTIQGQCGSGCIKGKETVLPNQVYVVHSEKLLGGALNNTSNIYVIKGMNDTVWIFGFGYGDKTLPGDTSDLQKYIAGIDAGKLALDDARFVDTIITNDFGILKANAKINFIVPHFHLDHVNQEFVIAFFSTLGYSDANTKIFVHTKDYTGSTCSLKCCGTASCTSTNQYWASPYIDPWTTAQISAYFVTIGSTNNACNNVLKTITTSYGNWTVLKGKNKSAGGHTDGSVNMQNATKKWRINGADGGSQCSIPPGGYKVLPIHGNLPPLRLGEEPLETFPSCIIFPNPTNGDISILIEEDADLEGISFSFYDEVGIVIYTIENVTQYETTFTIPDVPAGMYFYAGYKNGHLLIQGKVAKL